MTISRTAINLSFRERSIRVLTTAMVSVVLFGFLGLAVDTGYLQLIKRRMEFAADAAAIAGAQEIQRGASIEACEACGVLLYGAE